MASNVSEQIADVHVRLGKLEKILDPERHKSSDSPLEDFIEIVCALAALVFSYYGFGLPNHTYQYIFGILIIVTLYHRESFPRPRRLQDWTLAIINILVLSMLLKLIIGGGNPRPFYWAAYPTVEGGLSSFNLNWQQIGISEWVLPLTTIQTFFLVLTLFGTLLKFELFCGLTAFVLVLLSLPTLVSFNWNWALPAMIASLFSFYLQADEKHCRDTINKN